MYITEYFSLSTAATNYRGHSVVLDSHLQLVGMQLKSTADLTTCCKLTRGHHGQFQSQELITDICTVMPVV